MRQGGLAGGGQHVAFNQLVVEFLMGDGNAVDVFFGSEADGQGNDLNLSLQFRGKISGGVNDNSDAHMDNPPKNDMIIQARRA